LETTLEKIIKGCIQGKSEAQSKLFKLLSPKMYGICLRYTKNTVEAEDVLHDGFIKIFQNVKNFKNEGSFEGWMRRIMVNTALESCRHDNIMYLASDVKEMKEDFSCDDITSNIDAADLMKFIQELSPQYQMVFNLYAIDGYSHDEIAEMLNISVSTSKSNLSRARKVLQEKVIAHFYSSEKIKQLNYAG